MIFPSPKLQHLSAYPFERLNKLLSPYSPPKDPCFLHVGEPQHAPPQWLNDVLNRNDHLWNKYPPFAGTPELRQAIAQWICKRYHLDPNMINPHEHIAPLSGTREGLYLIAQIVLDQPNLPNHPLIFVPNPFYQTYGAAGVMNECQLHYLHSHESNGFLPNLDEITDEQWQRCVMFYFCSPSNPEGACADKAYFDQLIALTTRHNVTLIIDACYCDIYTHTPPYHPFESYGQNQHSLDHILSFHSLSKRSNVAGMRSGFVAGDPKLIASFKKLRSYASPTMPLPIQAASTALWDDEQHVQANREKYQEKFRIAHDILGFYQGFYTPKGGFYLWLEVKDAQETAVKLWREKGIKTVPGSYFTHPNEEGENHGSSRLRLALVQEKDIIVPALREVGDILQN